MDPPHTAAKTENTQDIYLFCAIQDRMLMTLIKRQLTEPCSADLLQGRSTKLDGDVSEEAVSLRAEISDDVWVCVRRSEELHLPFCHFKTLWQYTLHCNLASIKFSP